MLYRLLKPLTSQKVRISGLLILLIGTLLSLDIWPNNQDDVLIIYIGLLFVWVVVCIIALAEEALNKPLG